MTTAGSAGKLGAAPHSKFVFCKYFGNLRGGMAVWINGLPFLRTIARIALDVDQKCSAGPAIVMGH